MTSASSSDAAGAWSQESRDGLRALAARSAAVATARGGQWRWAAQWGWAGSAAPSASAWTRRRRASGSPWSGSTFPTASRTRAATACGPCGGEGPRRAWVPSRRASSTVSSRGRRASGPWGPEARLGVLMGGPPGAGQREFQLVRECVIVPEKPNEQNPKEGTSVRGERVGARPIRWSRPCPGGGAV